MKKAKLILANYDARISKIDIKPKNKFTKVTLSSRMYNEKTDKKETAKIVFVDVAAIDFRINYFDSMIGAEAMGLYEIIDKNFIEQLVKKTFERRKELYLLEGNYNYNENDEYDMLNTFDLMNIFTEEKDSYHAYVQNVDAGVYIIVAKEIQIIR
ncbi:MAG: hypothetical protein Q4F79_06075 [Eubacteriales bacterium]|nr:hypothetical protein [Eubacteriales bacterium]